MLLSMYLAVLMIVLAADVIVPNLFQGCQGNPFLLDESAGPQETREVCEQNSDRLGLTVHDGAVSYSLTGPRWMENRVQGTNTYLLIELLINELPC
jgi:hypothetical protein